MNIGDIFYWITDHAVGHDSRPKYHVYVCPADWVDDNTFLFINKGMYGEDYTVTKADYPFLEYDSYISCFGTTSYSDQEISAFDQTSKGSISKAHLNDILLLVDKSRVMERLQKKRICAALQKAIA
jgi:hypothetical protein